MLLTDIVYINSIIKFTDMTQPTIRYSYSFFDKFSIQSKAPNSNDILLRCRDTQQLILMKQIEVNPGEFEETLATLEFEKMLSHEQLLSLVDYCPQPSNSKFIVLYQFCDITLMDQFQNRLSQRRFFEQSELWSIFTSFIFGLAYLQEQNVGHGSISLSDCYLNEQGFIKVCDPTSATSNPYNVVKGYYYSPEILRCLVHETGQQINIFKNDMFALGCCMLQLTLMKDITEIFDYDSGLVLKPLLQHFLDKEIGSIGLSKQYLKILRQTLELEVCRRPDFVTLKAEIFQMINLDPSQQCLDNMKGSIQIKSSISSLCRSKGQPNIQVKQPTKQQTSQQKFKQSSQVTNPMILTFSQIGMLSQNGINQSKNSTRQALSEFLKIQPNVDYLFGNLKKSIHLEKQPEEPYIPTEINFLTKEMKSSQIMETDILNIQQNLSKIQKNLEKKRRHKQNKNMENLPQEACTPNNRNQLKKYSQMINIKYQKTVTRASDYQSKRVSSEIFASPHTLNALHSPKNLITLNESRTKYTNKTTNDSPFDSSYQFSTKNNKHRKSFLQGEKENVLRTYREEQAYTNPDFLKMMQADVQQILSKRKNYDI